MKLKFAQRLTSKNGVVEQHVTHRITRSDAGAMTCASQPATEHGPGCVAVAGVAEFIASQGVAWAILWSERADKGVTLAVVGSPKEWVDVRRGGNLQRAIAVGDGEWWAEYVGGEARSMQPGQNIFASRRVGILFSRGTERRFTPTVDYPPNHVTTTMSEAELQKFFQQSQPVD